MEHNHKLWEEFLDDSRGMDLSSFKLKDTLNEDIWLDEDTIESEVLSRLRELASDFMETLGLNHVPILDITLTGSLANYNWSNYSDLDLHLIVDFDDIDDNYDLVRDFFSLKTSIWNSKHNIKLRGFEVEIYVQDNNEKHTSTGVYSLLHGAWLKKPSRENPKIDFSDVEKKAKRLIDLVNHVEKLFDDKEYKEADVFASILKEKIKKFRRCGLDASGQYSPENLAFKVLRRTGDIERLHDLKIRAYDMSMSLTEDFSHNWSQYTSRKRVI